MEKTTYKFTAFVECFYDFLNRSIRYYAGVNSAGEALSWIRAICPLHEDSLVNFGFYETKNDK